MDVANDAGDFGFGYRADIYSITENLVLWARSEKIGCAVIQHSGMMECWSVGILGLAEWDLFLWGWHGMELQI